MHEICEIHSTVLDLIDSLNLILLLPVPVVHRGIFIEIHLCKCQNLQQPLENYIRILFVSQKSENY